MNYLLHRCRAFSFAIILACPGAAFSAPLVEPAFVDFAPEGTVRADAIIVSPADMYDPSRGLGWLRRPDRAFALPAFGGVRTPALVDGVEGGRFVLRLDLAPGAWTAIVHLDDGHRDAHRVALEIGGRQIAHNPRVFGLEEEPAAPPINRYRVAQFDFHSTGQVELSFSQGTPGARALALWLLPRTWEETDLTRWFERQVADAGSFESRASLDALRFELEQHGRDPSLRAFATYWKCQLDLLAEAHHWHASGGWDWFSAKTRSSMFTRYKIAVALLDPLVEHPDGEAFPLIDRARWLRARLLYWIWREQHLAEDEPAFRADLAELRRRHPDNDLLAMYSDERVPTAEPVAPLPGAPAWSAAQFEALSRLRDVAHYWVDERQIPNGEFGGKTDDDVELLRWWSPLMFSGDAKGRAGFARLAEGVWHSPRMHLGYSRVVSDVEHSAEFVADTAPLLALLERERTQLDRLEWSYRHMRDLWTGRNEHGDLQFKSAWIGASDIILEAPRNRDLAMNTRAAKAVRYYAWLSGDDGARALLRDWSLAWARAAARNDKGKPRGLFPASLRWPDAAFNGDEPTWHRANMFWRYFDWSGDGDLYDQLLFSWLDSRDERLLKPLHDTLDLLARFPPADAPDGTLEGSAAWAAGQLRGDASFWAAVAHWRLETGDPRHDALLLREAPPYVRFRLTGDPSELAPAIETTLLQELRHNRPMRTTEVLFTDRVRVARDHGAIKGTDLLSAMLTGCHAADGVSPYFHVAWDEAPAGFTALVKATGPDRFGADVYLHQADPGRVTARFLRLRAGEFRLTVRTEEGATIVDRIERVAGPEHRTTLDLPGDTLLQFELAERGI